MFLHVTCQLVPFLTLNRYMLGVHSIRRLTAWTKKLQISIHREFNKILDYALSRTHTAIDMHVSAKLQRVNTLLCVPSM